MMTGNHDSSVVAFSSKIAIKQSGDKAGMSPSKPGIIVWIPVSLDTVGMHYQDVSRRP